MPRTKVVFEVVVMMLYKAFKSVVRDLQLNNDQAEEIFKKARSFYAQNSYTTAILWVSPLDDDAQGKLYERFRHDLSLWIVVHGFTDGLSGLLQRYLREETLRQLEILARERQRAVLRKPEVVEDLSDQGVALSA